MNFFKSRTEQDFEFFVKALPALEPVEFSGLAKILGVKMVRTDVTFSKEEFERLKENETMSAKLEEILLPMDEVLEKMMDRFLELPKRRRKEINDILRAIKTKNEVTANGTPA